MTKTDKHLQPHSDERVARVQQYVEHHYRDELPLSVLAALAGMTPTAYNRHFRRATGQTLSDYIIQVRIRHICHELLTTDEPVKDICYVNGFNTLSNFNKSFRRIMGCTPTEYRLKIKE